MKETKPFYETSEFWLLLIGQIVLTLQSSDVINLMAERYNWIAPILQVLLAASYIISRGRAKGGVPYTGSQVSPEGIEEFSLPTTPPSVVQPGTNIDVPEDTTET